MKVVVAMDSMKGSLSSLEAGNAVSEGIHRVFRDAEVTVCPLADGGEGTVEALTLGMNGTIEILLIFLHILIINSNNLIHNLRTRSTKSIWCSYESPYNNEGYSSCLQQRYAGR